MRFLFFCFRRILPPLRLSRLFWGEVLFYLIYSDYYDDRDVDGDGDGDGDDDGDGDGDDDMMICNDYLLEETT